MPFSEVVHAARTPKHNWTEELVIGKADFQSAFKTVPVAETQDWLCWALVYNPVVGRHQVAKLNTQTFGSLGAVVAWYRTARAIRTVMAKLGLVILVYVDGCFWAAPKYQPANAPDATWILRVFEYVTGHLLGWQLDPLNRQRVHV